MNREDIIRMAREADLGFLLNENWLMHEELERFAALVASAEREACARVCDEYAQNSSNPMNFAENCAKSIRAKGQA